MWSVPEVRMCIWKKQVILRKFLLSEKKTTKNIYRSGIFDMQKWSFIISLAKDNPTLSLKIRPKNNEFLLLLLSNMCDE